MEENGMKKLRQSFTVLIAMSLFLVLLVPMVQAGPPSDDIKDLYMGDRAFAHIEALVAFGSRVTGGGAEMAAANYIATKMESYGLDVEIQEFPIIYFENLGSTLEVQGGPVLSPNTMEYSPSGDFTVEIVDCGLGFPGDFPAVVAGKIALIERGVSYFWDKTQNASAAGAIAAIIYNNFPGNFFGTLGSITDIPAVSISQEEGIFLLGLLSGGSVTVHLDVDTVAYFGTSRNIIGTLEGLKPDQGIVYMGAHYDSVSAGPGANDDASGVAAMLEAARVLSTRGHRTMATLKFIAFGAEEIGLDGSYNYVVANFDEVSTMGIGMINLDMIAVGDTLLIGNIDWGGPDLKDYAGEKASDMGLMWEPFTAGSNSDHTYFEAVGVPAVCLHQSPDPWWHTPEDTPDKIDVTTLEENGELATATMYGWAKNPSLRAKAVTTIT
jgi:aminopeptidase YwaD